MPDYTEIVSIALPEGTKARIEEVARPRGLKLSVWIRELVLRQLAEENPPAAS